MAKSKGKASPARWLREAQGVVALGLAAYVTVALLSYDPTLHWLDQGGRVGVVGLWIGWAMFTAVGYASYLVPLALVAWAVSAFARDPACRARLKAAIAALPGNRAVYEALEIVGAEVAGANPARMIR